MTLTGIYFILGMCVMFYFMMTWLFLRKNSELLSRLAALLMFVIGIQSLKDLFFFQLGDGLDDYLWMVMTSVDMVAVPLYAFILIELCRPGTLTLRKMILHESPFIALPLLFIVTRMPVFYYVNVGWAAVYGSFYAIWTTVEVPKYHRRLKERFSYDENINLKWLSIIMMSFYFILALWIVDCLIVDLDIEAVYMTGSLLTWMFICYFIYRHESVMDELSGPYICESTEKYGIDNEEADVLTRRITALFEEERIFLNPQLKLSDVAAMSNTNRTYVSRFFNGVHGKTFYEFVNEYRIRHAKNLLKTTSERLDVIAEQAGFSSRQSFHRVFSKMEGCTPEQYRVSKD